MRTLAVIFVVAASVTAQDSAPISLLASGAVEGSIVALAKTIPPADAQFLTSQGIADRLASGAVPDVLIAQSSVIDNLITSGKAIADSRVPLGRIPIGVAIGPRSGRPDVSSIPALRAAILEADRVVISRGASGTVLENMFRDLGIASQIESRLQRELRGDDVMKRLAESPGNAMGFTMVSEIKYGERYGGRYVGPIPDPVQVYTRYDAVALTASHVERARAWVRALATPAARRVLTENGWLN